MEYTSILSKSSCRLLRIKRKKRQKHMNTWDLAMKCVLLYSYIIRGIRLYRRKRFGDFR